MANWLYQMNGKDYTVEMYRKGIWEGCTIKWPTGRIKSGSGSEIFPGDTVILFFTRSDTREPGIYGWGIIKNVKKKQNEFSFRLVYPSDYLKMNPIWDDHLSNLLDEIRGPVKVGTMWEISFENSIKLKQIIHKWITK